MSEARPVLLIGSVPLESAEAVFGAVAASLGDLVKRIPDGETGERLQWIMWQGEIVRGTPGLAAGGQIQVPGGIQITRFKLAPGCCAAQVRFGPLGYAASARRSYEVFKALRAQGVIAPTTRFQVSLPTALAVMFAFVVPEDLRALWPLYEQRLLEELDEIVAGIAPGDLAIQWDVAVEINSILEVPEVAARFPREELIASLVRAAHRVPQDVELGLHLCYGDPGHKHMIEPKDTRVMVDLANDLSGSIQRQIHWVHMPVPRERHDAAYFEPLRDLTLQSGTELYLGLAHLTDGLSGAERRLRSAQQVVPRFGIATECGWGRRPPESISQLLALHRAVAELEV